MPNPALVCVTEPHYRIKHSPGFDHLEFSPSSDTNLALPAAIAYRADFGGQLQSADEAIAFRVATSRMAEKDRDRAAAYQTTRTATIRFVKDGDIYIAADDSPNPEESILLNRAQEGYERNSKGIEWLVDRNDPLITNAIERATAAGRVYSAFDTNQRQLALDNTFSQDPLVQSIAPQTAHTYERLLREQGHSAGYTWDLTAKQCENAGVNDTTVLIRRAGVGDYLSSVGINADGSLDSGGRARRVRERKD